MNISSTTSAAAAWAAAAPTSTRAADSASASESSTLDASPDVVVTLNQSISSAGTYDASGRLPGGAPPASADEGGDGAASDGSGGDAVAASGSSESSGLYDASGAGDAPQADSPQTDELAAA